MAAQIARSWSSRQSATRRRRTRICSCRLSRTRISRHCGFGVLFYGKELAAARGGEKNVEAALALVRDLNVSTRFYILPMRGGGNATGAENVLTWQTGYPFAVNLGRGYPRFGPSEFTASAI